MLLIPRSPAARACRRSRYRGFALASYGAVWTDWPTARKLAARITLFRATLSSGSSNWRCLRRRPAQPVDKSAAGARGRATGTTVARILRNNGLKPHPVRKYKVSRDPEFAAKVQDVVGVYLNPPENVVSSIDEKTYTVPSMYMEWTWSCTSAITRRTFDCWAGTLGLQEYVGEIRDKALISFVAAPTPAARNREGSPGARALFASLTAVHVKRWM